MKTMKCGLSALLILAFAGAALGQSNSTGSYGGGQQQSAQPYSYNGAKISRGPMIQYADDQLAVVTWSTDTASESRVLYGTDASNLNQIAENSSSGTSHRVNLTNLQPSTTYYFRIDNGQPGGYGSSASNSSASNSSMDTMATDSFQTVAGGAAPIHDQQPAKINQPQSASVSKPAVIQYVDDKTAVLNWSTNQAVASRLYYGTNANSLDQMAEEPGANTYHRVHLSNLKPNTTYYFQIETGQDSRAPESSFSTVASGVQPLYDQQPRAVNSNGSPVLARRQTLPASGGATTSATTTPSATSAAPQLIVPAGTEIDATLQEALSSKTAKIGDRFTAVTTQPVKSSNGQIAIPAGTTINGEVIQAEEGKTLPIVRGKGRLNLRFRDLTLPSHTSFPLSATLVSIHGSNASSEGEVQSSTSAGTAVKDVGIGAGIGTVAGLIFGSALKGLAIGAIAGGGYVLATKGKDVEVPAKSGMKLKLDQSLNIPVSAVGSVSTNTGGH